MSEQNLNDMSNALEKTAYVENGKLYDNDNNLIDIGNAKITLGSYVGIGGGTISFNVGPNQKIFMMLSNINGTSGGDSTLANGSAGVYWNGFFIVQISIPNNNASSSAYIPGTYVGQSEIIYIRYNGSTITISLSNGSSYNRSGGTYHYATIGV